MWFSAGEKFELEAWIAGTGVALSNPGGTPPAKTLAARMRVAD
jgi:hypothetical protein